MSCIVYQVDKKTGVKYAYESESYWDKDKQQPRSRRTYLGKVDPETGEIIPKEKRGSHSDSKKEKPAAELDRLFEEIKAKDATISELREELNAERKSHAGASLLFHRRVYRGMGNQKGQNRNNHS